MNYYYLMAQLPSLDAVTDTSPLPITEERFCELCNRFLGSKAAAVINTLTLIPKSDGKPTGNTLVDSRNRAECELRTALAEARAEKMQKPFEKSQGFIPQNTVKTAHTAVDMKDPLEAELYLNRFRLDILETLRPSDPFSVSMVYYYGLKLKLLSRIKNFDTALGEKEYRNIYNSIIRGEIQETTD